METITSGNLWSLKNASALCVALGTFATFSTLQADTLGEAQKDETARRIEKSLEAKQLLAVGDDAYQAAQYKNAVEAYGRARGLLPESKATADYSEALNDRYAKAVVEYSKVLIREGKVEESQKLLDSLTETKTFENDPLLAKASNDAYDPIRTNPSVTGEHAKNVDEVRKLLYESQGAVDAGLFDKAFEGYEQILRIDPTNQAARRGMSAVSAHRASYGRAAYDEARSRLLSDVDKAWEIKPLSEAFLGSTIVGGLGEGANPITLDTRNKISKIIIPRFDVDNVSIATALENFKLLVRENDPEPDISKKGINVVLSLGGEFNELGQEIAQKKFSLNLNNVPADKLLDLICRQSNTEWKAEQYALTVVPSGQLVSELFVRQFRVPPNFFSQPFEKTESSDVIFQDIGSAEVTRRNNTVQGYLESLGVSFPQGAKAQYVVGRNLLTVVNTPANMRVLAQAIQGIKNNQNLAINVKLKVIDVTENDLDELGYDWILGAQEFGGNGVLGGGSPGNGVPVIPIQSGGNSAVDGAAITSGNRSGGNAFTGDSILSRIAAGNDLSQLGQAANSAPGVLAFTALRNNSNVQLILRGLAQSTGSSNIWAPSVTVRPGERARLEEVRLFIYPTEYDPPEVPDNIGTIGGGGPGTVSSIPITPAIPTAFEEKAVGRIFEVEASVDNNRRYINLNLAPTFSEFIGFVNYGSPIFAFSSGLNAAPVPVVANDILMPIFEEIKTNTSVTVADGATIVIGGLKRVEVQQVNDRVPVLSSLPFIGDYFKSNGNQTLERAIVIFVSAELVDLQGNPWRDKNLEQQ